LKKGFSKAVIAMALLCLFVMLIPGQLFAGKENKKHISPAGSGTQPLPPPVFFQTNTTAPKSPFISFRGLLNKTPEELEASLEKRPKRFHPTLLAKIEEYRKLSDQERERRLQSLDLRWYIISGVNLPENSLDEYVNSIPKEYQEIIRERLTPWYKMPLEHRQNILTNVKSVNPLSLSFQQKDPDANKKRPQFQQNGPRKGPPGKDVGQGGPRRFRYRGGQGNPEMQAERFWNELNEFFRMSRHDRSKVLKCLEGNNRETVEKIFTQLDDLPPVERQRSLKLLLSISELPQSEQEAFIRSAEQWNSLSKEEKRFFRTLILPQQVPPMPQK